MLNYKTIRKLRTRRGLTQAECAKAVGMKRAHDWYRVEKGIAGLSLTRLARAAKLLKCPMEDLVKLS